MESVETVDVSWLHHSQKDHLSRTKPVSSTTSDKSATSTETTTEAQIAEKPHSNTNHHPSNTTKPPPDSRIQTINKSQDEVKPRAVSETPGEQKVPTPASGTPQNGTIKPIGRRGSWISSLSSKFSSSGSAPAQNTQKENVTAPKPIPTPSKLDFHNPFGAAYSPKDKEERNSEGSNPFTASSPRSGFLHNALRKLSSSSTNGSGKMATNGVICQRRVMNVDQNRDRCRVPDLNQAKLRRVAFCVDVEIAGTSRRESDDEKPDSSNSHHHHHSSHSNKTDAKSKEKGEGAVLKNPNAIPPEEKKEPAADPGKEPVQTNGTQGDTKTDGQVKEQTRKQEKKKRSEEERKERKERKRRQAEANGSIPMQLRLDDDDDDSSSAPTPGTGHSKTQTHPTTDPVRIYRRCCQLRETPVLKKVVEQISSSSSILAESPGTVAVLDLTDFPMTLEDIITFSDWLAIVPVRKLILENCALTDEAVRSILAGLLATKTVEQARKYRRRSRKPKSQTNRSKEESFGVVEKLSLKNNPKIGPEGWRHICLFVHLSKSLKAIDLSGIPFPKSHVVANGSGSANRSSQSTVDIGTVFASALEKRFGGDHLEELLLSECHPTTDDVGRICDAAIAFGLRRFGLASNDLTREGLQHVIRYLQAGKCEGLDLGGNPLEDHLDLLTSVIDCKQPLYAISLADCLLTPPTLGPLLQAFPRLPNLRFVDLSHNRDLFASQPDALAMLRRYLPKMPYLKRIHLADVDLSPDHAIALAEILPECPSLCHLNILENRRISKLSTATDPASQEEACAVYASLMAAVRVSHTIIAVDIEVPTAESNEVVKALASQIVAYSLRNLECSSMEEAFSGSTDLASERHVPIPEILQHIVGHGDGDEVGEEEDDAAPDEDYVIGGTGVVKALGVCLGNADHHHSDSLDFSAPPSGTTTPRHRRGRSRPPPPRRPRDMAKNLLESARNIRLRIQSALVHEDRAGNDTNYRRLQFLDYTLQKMIQRFEDEYPETRVIPPLPPPVAREDSSSQHSTDEIHGHGGISSGSPPSGNHYDDETAIDDEDAEHYVIGISRSSSNTSLHSRALTSEEGHIHRVGQSIRRDFLKDYPAAVLSTSPLDESHFSSLREKLEHLRGEQIRSRVESVGPEKALEELGCTMEELWWIQKQDAEAFQKFKESQIAAQINGGIRPAPLVDEEAVDTSAIE